MDADVAEVGAQTGFEETSGRAVKQASAGAYDIPDRWRRVRRGRRRGRGKCLLTHDWVFADIIFFFFASVAFAVDLI